MWTVREVQTLTYQADELGQMQNYISQVNFQCPTLSFCQVHNRTVGWEKRWTH